MGCPQIEKLTVDERMVEEYKVAVITPCYNIEKFSSNKDNLFELNIKSVQNQTIGYENIEHILVNDASTDNTKEILDDLSAKWSNIKVFHLKENTGRASLPRNFGLEHSSADYVMFLDQDDFFENNTVETLYGYINSNDINMVASNHYVSDNNNTMKKNFKSKGNVFLEYNSPDLEDFMTLISTKMFKKEFLLENNIRFPNFIGEDSYFNILCLVNNKKKILILNDFCSYTYIADNESSLSHRFNKKQITDSVFAYSSCLDLLKEHNMNEHFISVCYYNALIMLLGFLIQSEETKENKDEMFKEVQKFIREYEENINLEIYWNIMYKLVKNNQKHLFFIISYFIRQFFESNWFKKMFRFKKFN